VSDGPAEPDGDQNDPLHTMRAERVERDDGRYLIYFSWPVAVADVQHDEPSPHQSAPGSDPAGEG
jgi:hypothetical protein